MSLQGQRSVALKFRSLSSVFVLFWASLDYFSAFHSVFFPRFLDHFERATKTFVFCMGYYEIWDIMRYGIL